MCKLGVTRLRDSGACMCFHVFNEYFGLPYGLALTSIPLSVHPFLYDILDSSREPIYLTNLSSRCCIIKYHVSMNIYSKFGIAGYYCVTKGKIVSLSLENRSFAGRTLSRLSNTRSLARRMGSWVTK